MDVIKESDAAECLSQGSDVIRVVLWKDWFYICTTYGLSLVGNPIAKGSQDSLMELQEGKKQIEQGFGS